MIPTNKPVQNPIHIKQEKKSWNIGNLEIKKERTSLKIRPCLIIKAIPNAAKIQSLFSRNQKESAVHTGKFDFVIGQ